MRAQDTKESSGWIPSHQVEAEEALLAKEVARQALELAIKDACETGRVLSVTERVHIQGHVNDRVGDLFIASCIRRVRYRCALRHVKCAEYGYLHALARYDAATKHSALGRPPRDH
jgi:hypothetical protein